MYSVKSFDRVKLFYFSVYLAALKCNLVSNKKPKAKLKCYLSDENKKLIFKDKEIAIR